MRLRGYEDRTPVNLIAGKTLWPETFVTTPSQQFALLRSKYVGKRAGRIGLPRSTQDLWAQHKYSVMARDPAAYRSIGSRVARLRRATGMAELAEELVRYLRTEPLAGRLCTAVEHLWGYVRKWSDSTERRFAQESAANMLRVTQELAWSRKERYLLSSTALSDLAVFVRTA
jgi:hypothetical protein